MAKKQVTIDGQNMVRNQVDEEVQTMAKNQTTKDGQGQKMALAKVQDTSKEDEEEKDPNYSSIPLII